jgi:hypothetical protein
MTRSSTCALFLLVLTFLVPVVARAAPPAAKPDAPPPAALAEAKKNFEVGLKLYKEGLLKEALAAFIAADKIVPRASVERNIGQCQRDLKDFAGAYETYVALLDKFSATLKPTESTDVKRAVDELALLTGTIEVKTGEADAMVTLDDNVIGKTPLAKPFRVNIGTHNVKVTKAGFEPFSKQVDCRGSDQNTVDAALQKEVLTGHLAVTGVGGITEGVVVSVDGKEVGPLPWEGDLEPGSHQVSGQGPQSASAAVRVEITRKARTDVALELQDQMGVVYVDPHNAEAEISVDGKVMAKGVWEGKVSAGRHEVAIAAPLFRPYRRVLMVHVGERIVENTPLQLEEGVNLHSFAGLYVGIDLLGRFGTAPPASDLAENCPVQKGSCDVGKPAGAGALLRIGYSFGWLGLEGIGFASLDHSSSDAQYQAYLTESMSPHYGLPRHETHDLTRFGAGAALGVRATSKHSVIRFTAGTGFGVAFRNMNAQVDAQFDNLPLTQNCLNCNNSDHRNWGNSVGKVAPVLLFDASLLLGSTPGTKFQLGALAMVEFYGDPVMTDAQSPDSVGGYPLGRPALQVAKGTEVFIGPVLGLQFGE